MCRILGNSWRECGERKECELGVSVVCVCVLWSVCVCVRTCTDVTALLCPRRNLMQVPVDTSHSYRQPSLHKEGTLHLNFKHTLQAAANPTPSYSQVYTPPHLSHTPLTYTHTLPQP